MPPELHASGREGDWTSVLRRITIAGMHADHAEPVQASRQPLGYEGAPAWVDRPMRWAQMAFVGNDPGRYDPGFWLDYFKRVQAQGVCLSAGGCMAFYPTQVSGHYRSPFMGQTDPFGELLAGCREMGMVALARTDPHACHDSVAQAHPEWIACDADGRPRRHWAHPDYWVTCTLGPYSFDFMTRVTEEIIHRYAVEGIFCNRWSGSGPCYCESCQALFKDRSERELPRQGDPTAHWVEYSAWRQGRLMDLWQLWERRIMAIKPEARLIPNIGGGPLSELDMDACGRRAVMMVADRQGRHGQMPPWALGRNAKEYRAVLGNKPAVGLVSVGLEQQWRWKDSVQSEAELRLWILDGIAQGLRPWFVKFSAIVRDPRWLDPVERIFRWHATHEPYLRHEASLARIGLVYSQQSARCAADAEARERIGDAVAGAYQALLEGRFCFDMVHDRLLDADSLARYKLLVLPDITALSDIQCAQIVAFVERGGSVVATFETSRFDESGARREALGLGDLFGVSIAGEVEGPMRNAYLELSGPHPVLSGLEAAPRIIHGVHRLPVAPRVDFPSPVKRVPSYPDLPMEEVYPRGEAGDEREMYLREAPAGAGSGRVAYFNWDIDRTYHEVQAPDHGRLLANAVRWALDEPPIVEVEGQGLLDLAVWRQRDSMICHLVNLTNPMSMRGPCRELIRSPPQRIRLHVPPDRPVKGVRCLVSGDEIAWAWDGEYIETAIEAILDHEVIAVDLD